MAMLRQEAKLQRRAGRELRAGRNFRDQRLALPGVEMHECRVAERLQQTGRAGGRSRAIDDDMLRAYAENNIAPAEISGEGRWQRLLESRPTESCARRAALHR